MAKMTEGKGWALNSDEKPTPIKKNPNSPKPQVRLEKRNGKAVTVIIGLHTYGVDRLNKMAKELKSRCGAGGTVKKGNIEIQGDKLLLVKDWLAKNLDKKS